jgi:hypothetical protein
MTGDAGSHEEKLRELAERLLVHPHPEGSTSVELFVGRLPESLTLEIPLPPGSRLLGCALHSRRGRPTLTEAVFDVESDPQEMMSSYERELAKSGWNTFEGFGGMGGGFVPEGIGLGRSFRRGDQGPVLMVAVRTREARPSDLRLRLDWEIIRHLPEIERHGRPEGAERMPALRPPAGMPMRGGGGGGGGGTWHSQATVETDRPVAELQSHFDQQLERAGWKRLAGSADDVVGWSSWQLPGSGDWRGILLVLAAFGQSERALYLRIEASEATNGGWQVASMSSS